MSRWRPWRLPRKPSLRRPPLPATAKPRDTPRLRYRAEGGPYALAVLRLTDGNTAVFRVGRFYGRYECVMVAYQRVEGITFWRDRNSNP